MNNVIMRLQVSMGSCCRERGDLRIKTDYSKNNAFPLPFHVDGFHFNATDLNIEQCKEIVSVEGA